MGEQLTTHFSLSEMTTTSHSNVNNTPDGNIKANLIRLCSSFLEPIRAKFGPIRVTSGYRSKELNAVIPGSAKDSAHCYGCAADIQSMNGHDVTEMVRWVAAESGLDFDQVIDEQKGEGRWMHIGMLRPKHEPRPRHQALVMRDGKYAEFTL